MRCWGVLEEQLIMTAKELWARVRSLSHPERAKACVRFFKTGPGESGEGLRFLGLDAANLRAIAKEFRTLPLTQVETALHSEWHEERAAALLILVLQFPKADAASQKSIYDFYLANTSHVNSWALVDCSAPHIVGAYLFDKSRKPLEKLPRSKSLWERRIAMVSTQHFIRKGEFADTFRIAKLLLKDDEDLIHKATGWMLREVGERDQGKLEAFLRDHYRVMPRTMLRYAIEKFAERKRQAYLSGTV
jgi:3-methyladenine DNA glycosylase AlkD